MPTFLHVGCGPLYKKNTTAGFNTNEWSEIRLDIDARVSPDIVGSMTNLGMIDTGSIDAIYSSHNIEHLYAHEIFTALTEFRRVLNKDGFAVIICPDLQSVCEMVAQNKLLDTAFMSPVGAITPFDIIYGHRASISTGNHFMAHKSGFTQQVLANALQAVGFGAVTIYQRPAPFFDLHALATVAAVEQDVMRTLARQHLPLVDSL